MSLDPEDRVSTYASVLRTATQFGLSWAQEYGGLGEWRRESGVPQGQEFRERDSMVRSVLSLWDPR